MLVDNLLAKGSTAGETKVHLMSRSEFVLILQRDSQPNAGPKNASTQKTRELDRDSYLSRCNYIRDRIKTLISCCGCVTWQLPSLASVSQLVLNGQINGIHLNLNSIHTYKFLYNKFFKNVGARQVILTCAAQEPLESSGLIPTL